MMALFVFDCRCPTGLVTSVSGTRRILVKRRKRLICTQPKQQPLQQRAIAVQAQPTPAPKVSEIFRFFFKVI